MLFKAKVFVVALIFFFCLQSSRANKLSANYDIRKKSINSKNTDVQATYDGYLRCTIKKNFCVMLQYLEFDYFSAAENLQLISPQCTTTGEIEHRAVLNITGADGIGDFFYEPYLAIYHDCGPSVLVSYLFLPEIDFRQPKSYDRFKKDITNDGMKVGSYIEKRLLQAEEFNNQTLKLDVLAWIRNENPSFKNSL